jgi:hypothetical protein
LQLLRYRQEFLTSIKDPLFRIVMLNTSDKVRKNIEKDLDDETKKFTELMKSGVFLFDQNDNKYLSDMRKKISRSLEYCSAAKDSKLVDGSDVIRSEMLEDYDNRLLTLANECRALSDKLPELMDKYINVNNLKNRHV